MSKYSGVIGFATSVEINPGVWEDQIEEKAYRGDILRNTRRWDDDTKINNNIKLNNRVSILSDLYLQQHIPYIKYIEWNGVKWKVGEAEINRPRIIFSLGDVYNGPTP